MKKMTFLLLVMALFSCKTTSVTTTKVNGKLTSQLKGSWTITNIYLPGKELAQATAFGNEPLSCFENSEWQLVANNNTGKVHLSGTNCSQSTYGITWFVNQENQMIIKFLNDKAKKVLSGYSLSVSTITTNSFQLTETLKSGNSPLTVVYTFTKK